MTDTGCVVVGGGPGGMVLAHLLARAGIEVTLLEAHQDFDRDFRGDSLHPYTLELLDRLGLAEDLLRLDHFRAERFRLHTPTATVTTAEYDKLDSPFPYVALMPQARFLDFLAERSAALPAFTLRTGARVRELVRDDHDRVTGVRWRDADGEHTLTGRLVVAADGRFSKLRALAGLPVEPLGASSDLLWFRLPRRADDPPEADVDLYFGAKGYVGLLGGTDTWQVGYTLPKGGFAAAREAGVGPIRDFVVRYVPWLADRVSLLREFSDTTLLSVEISRAVHWHRPGLLMIGDAAHVISPVGGNGILMAVQDAVAAADRLVPALRADVTDRRLDAVLAAVQHDREPAIRQVQAQQVRIERRAAAAREAGRPMVPGRLLAVVTSIPGARVRAARSNAYGPNPPALTVDVSVGGAACAREVRPAQTSPVTYSHQLNRLADAALDRLVVPGYSRIGYQVRRSWWPADPAPDALGGTVAVVTGAGGGLGLATAAGLARLGARVRLVVRDETKGRRAAEELAATVQGADLRVDRCDLSSLADVRRYAAELADAEPELHVLVHNAGLLPPKRVETDEGHEVTLATHVLGPLLLTELLRPALSAGEGRVVFVSSGGMYTQRLHDEDPEYRAGTYRGATAYARTKRMQVVLTELLAEKLADQGIVVHSCHPGWADTPGVTASLPGFQKLVGPLLRSPEQGADTVVWLAAADEPGRTTGRFWQDRAVRTTHAVPWTRETPAARERLWRFCAAAVDLSDQP